MGCAASSAVLANRPGGSSQDERQATEEYHKSLSEPPELSSRGKRESITWGATPVKAEAVNTVSESRKKMATHRLSTGPSKKLLKTKLVPAVRLIALRRNSAVMMAQYKQINVSMNDKAERWLASAKQIPEQNPCQTGLFFAAQQGHLEIIQLLLKATEENKVKVPPPHIANPMCAAAVNGHADIVTFLLAWAKQFQIDTANMHDESNSTPLKLVAAEGHSDILLELVEVGMNINATSKSGKTALMAAAEHGHTACVRILLAAGALVNMTTPSGAGAMILAARGGHLEVIQELVAHGADVQEFSLQGETPLFAAIEHNWPKVATYLLQHGEGTDGRNAEGASPLMLAAALGHSECVKALLDAGADINLGDVDGDTPLWAAAKEGYLDAARLLVDAGADVDQERDRGESPLWIAAYRNHIDMVQLLSEAGADIDCIDRKDVTPLLHCAAAGKTQLAKILIDDGADLNATDSKGNPVIIHAIVRGSFQILQMLVEAGADLLCADADGKGVLEVAMEHKQDRIAVYLSKKLGLEPPMFPSGLSRPASLHTQDSNATGESEEWEQEDHAADEQSMGGASFIKSYKSMTEEQLAAARMERMVSQQERREYRAMRRISMDSSAARSSFSTTAGAVSPESALGSPVEITKISWQPSSLRPADWEETRSRHVSETDSSVYAVQAVGAPQFNRSPDPDLWSYGELSALALSSATTATVQQEDPSPPALADLVPNESAG